MPARDHMKQTSHRNDAPARYQPDAHVEDPLAAELKPNALGAPRLRLLPGAAGKPRFGAGFAEAQALRPTGGGPLPRATFGEDEFAEDEDEDEFGDDEEDEFDEDEEDEDDEFDDDDEDDEFDEDEEEDDDEEEDGEVIADEEEDAEAEDEG